MTLKNRTGVMQFASTLIGTPDKRWGGGGPMAPSLRFAQPRLAAKSLKFTPPSWMLNGTWAPWTKTMHRYFRFGGGKKGTLGGGYGSRGTFPILSRDPSFPKTQGKQPGIEKNDG